MRYVVRCTARDCYLHNEARLPDVAAAEILAFAHQQRMADRDESHVVTVTEEVQPASNTSGGTGVSTKGDAHA